MSKPVKTLVINPHHQNRIKQTEEELKLLEENREGEIASKPEENDPPAEPSKGEVDWEKRYSDLRGHMSRKETEWKKEAEALRKEIESKTVEMPASDEDIDAWKEKYPDHANVIEAMALKQLKKRDVDLDQIKEAQAEAERQRHINQIRKAHSDFDDLQEDAAFHDWVEEQPQIVQDALYTGDDPKAAIRVIDLYKSDKGLTPKAKKAKEKEAAGFVDTKSKAQPDPQENETKFKESDIMKMSAAEYSKNAEKIDEANRKGNLIMDISGGAR